MSDFENKDYSLVESSPAECYHIYDGIENYFYTNSEEPISIPTIGTFVPAIVEREQLEVSTQVLESELSLSINIEEDFVRNNTFRFGKARMFIKAYRVQRGLPIATGYAIFYYGIVYKIDFSGDVAILKAQWSNVELYKKLIPQHTLLKCPHSLYGAVCGVTKTSFTFAGVISAFGDNQAEIKSSVFVGRACKFADIYNTRTKEHRIAYDYVSAENKVLIVRPFYTAVVGDSIIVTLGCLKTYSDCYNTFHNSVRFGGFSQIPVESPYAEAKIKRFS